MTSPLTETLKGIRIHNDPAASVFRNNEEKPYRNMLAEFGAVVKRGRIDHKEGAYRCWCAAWTSNPVIGAKTLDGGFDSHTLPPLPKHPQYSRGNACNS